MANLVKIKDLANQKNITLKSIAEQIGMTQQGLHKIIRNGSTNTETLEKISTILGVSSSVFFDEGTSNASFVGTATRAIAEDTIPVRFFEVTPTATFQEFCAGASENPSTINIIPAVAESLDETFCVFEVNGESMAPQINSHARVLCQEVPPTRWHTLINCIIVIAYADRFVIKRVIANHLQDENYLILASDNPAFPQQETVQLADIRAIFKARRIISSEIV